jgi:high-affinity K+ transport system ATPase subunit B
VLAAFNEHVQTDTAHRQTNKENHMQKTIAKLAATAAITLFTGAVFAQAAQPLPQERGQARIDARETRQEQRIDRGVASGQLTQREANRMQRGQAKVDNMEQRALANDGKIGKKEAHRIEHAQDVQSKRIYAQKHDRQKDLNHDGMRDKPAKK